MKRLLVVVGVLSTVACTPTGRSAKDQSRVSAATPALPAEVDPRGPVVMTLQTRDHEVAVYSVEGDLRFTVSLHGSGAVLAERVDEQEFSQAFPGIHQHFRTAFADDNCEGDPDAVGWAGL
jgi:hypothetical protein